MRRQHGDGHGVLLIQARPGVGLGVQPPDAGMHQAQQVQPGEVALQAVEPIALVRVVDFQALATEQRDLQRDLAGLGGAHPGEPVQGVPQVVDSVPADRAAHRLAQVRLGQAGARRAGHFGQGVSGEAADHLLAGLVALAAVIAAECLQALGQAEQRGRVCPVQGYRFPQVRQGLWVTLRLHQDGTEVPAREGVRGVQGDRLLQGHKGFRPVPQAGVGHAEPDPGVAVFGVEVGAAPQWLDARRHLAEFGQADAQVVGDLGVLEHAVQGLEDGQGVLQKAVPQQSQDVVLGVHAPLGDGEHPDVIRVHRDQGLPALGGVVEGVMHDHGLLESWRARGGVGGDDARCQVGQADLEDFRRGAGLAVRFCHAWRPVRRG